MSYLSDFFFLFFLLALCGASPDPSACRLFVRCGPAVQAAPRPAFCISGVNARAGLGDTNFELFPSADALKTCGNKTTLIFVLLGASGRCLERRPVQRGRWRLPGLARPTRCRC